MQWYDFLTPLEFAQLQRQAELLVAHCGTGSMLSALESGQPVLMMPRRHQLGEHRNDHQLATAQRLRHIPGVHVALNERELVERLDDLTRLGRVSPISVKAPKETIQTLARILGELA